MMKNILKTLLLTVIFSAIVADYRGWLNGAEASAATISLPKTGQTGCWDVSGNSVSCAGTGQDGDKQAGKTWPVQRFTDNNNGSVTDNLTGLIWLKNANCTDTVNGVAMINGKLTWMEALQWSIHLKDGNCSLADASREGDWRLPNITELESLIDAQQYQLLSPDHPFETVQPGFYWSSTTDVNFVGNAWVVDMMFGGRVESGPKSSEYFGSYVWPVRGGQ